MSTRSTITVKLSDKHYVGIYCHHDGYVEHVGKLLQTKYKTLEDITPIILLGAISCLKDTYEKTKKESYTLSCNEEPNIYVGSEITWGEDYNYLFEDGKWILLEGTDEEINEFNSYADTE